MILQTLNNYYANEKQNEESYKTNTNNDVLAQLSLLSEVLE